MASLQIKLIYRIWDGKGREKKSDIVEKSFLSQTYCFSKKHKLQV